MFRAILILILLISSLYSQKYDRYKITAIVGKESYVKGIKLYVDSINENGGINGKSVELKIYYDNHDRELAKKYALLASKDRGNLAVIGHSWSFTSLVGGEIYKEYKIPAITPTATNNSVTKDNRWYFRVIYPDSFGGKVLANYVKVILKSQNVTVINDDKVYGSFLSKHFISESKNIDLNVTNNYTIKTDISQNDIEKQIHQIIKELKTKTTKEIGVIFLSASSKMLVELVNYIKLNNIENKILISDSGAGKSFLEPIIDSKKRNILTNNLFIGTPYIFDIGGLYVQNFRKSYQAYSNSEEPTSEIAFGYDSVKVLIEAIKRAKIKNTKESIYEDREKIREALASMNSAENGVEGLTGVTFFDKEGDSYKLIKIGEVKNSVIVSSSTQLKEVSNINDVVNLNDKIKKELIFQVSDRYLYKTNIIHTGINIRKIDDINFEEKIFDVEFDLWFRGRFEINIADIIFENSTEPIEIIDKSYLEKSQDYIYQRYKIRGKFKMNTIKGANLIKEHFLAIQFYHKDLDINNLLFVKDFIGIDSEFSGFYENSYILNQKLQWNIKYIEYFQDLLKRSSMGHFKYVITSKSKIDHSIFNVKIAIAKKSISLSDFLQKHIILMILITTIILKLIKYILPAMRNIPYFIMFQYINTMIMLVTFKFVIIAYNSYFLEYLKIDYIKYIITLIDILYWFVSAYFLALIINTYIWRDSQTYNTITKHNTPQLVRRLILFSIYLFAFFGVISNVFNQDITNLLATSGVVAMILGLALKSNISSIFTGIAVNIEKPFELGDFIAIKSSGKEFYGKIIDMNWRTTKIETIKKEIVNIPNNTLSTAYIVNYQKVSTMQYVFKLNIAYPTKEILALLNKSIESINEVLKDNSIKKSSIKIKSIDDFSVYYDIKIVFENPRCFLQKGDIQNQLWSSFWSDLEEIELSKKYIKKQQELFFEGKKEDSSSQII